MDFNSFLKQKQFFSEEELRIIDDAFGTIAIPKGLVIQEAAQYSNQVIFIESGLLRTFYYKDGKDITHFFFDENYFVAPINSIYNHQTEPYGWESLEACKIRTIQYQDYLNLEDQFPKLTRLMLEFALHLLHLFSQKLDMVQFQGASDRYHLFLEMYPNIQNRVSLGKIASFLGISQPTLSVIRGQKK